MKMSQEIPKLMSFNKKINSDNTAQLKKACLHKNNNQPCPEETRSLSVQC